MKGIIFLIFIVLLIIIFTNLRNFVNKNKHNNTYLVNNYKIKKIMNTYEKYFYDILIELERDLDIRIHPKLNLATVIKKENNSYYMSELFSRNIDFAIFSRDYEELILLIKINYNNYNSKNTVIKDEKIKNILDSAGIPLIKFYSNYQNEKDYVQSRVKNEILKIRDKK